MGWKGALRSYGAYQRAQLRSERRDLREAQRAAREDLKQQKQQLAEQLVERYELQLRLLSTVHHECGPRIDWQEVAREPAPPQPNPISHKTAEAEAELATYRPGVFARMFGGAAKARGSLESQIETAKRADALETKQARDAYENACRDVEQARSVAAAVLRGEASRFADALDGVAAFAELEEVALAVVATAPRADAVFIEIVVPTADIVVPDEQHSLTQAGKLSTKKLPKTRGHQIFQDYVCGAALRACRDVFAALPVNWACATIRTEVLDPATGHVEVAAVLSVIAPRKTIEQLKYETLDPSDAMANFVHRMGFKKSAGLSSVEALTFADLPSA